MYVRGQLPRFFRGEDWLQIKPFALEVDRGCQIGINKKVRNREFRFDFHSCLIVARFFLWELWFMNSSGVGLTVLGFGITINWG